MGSKQTTMLWDIATVVVAAITTETPDNYKDAVHQIADILRSARYIAKDTESKDEKSNG